MNRYEKACREWLKGCSCAKESSPKECQDCTQAFLEKIRELKSDEKLILYFKCPSCGEALRSRIGTHCEHLECACGYTAEIAWQPNAVFHAGKVIYGRSNIE